jgi:hypothetical protein
MIKLNNMYRGPFWANLHLLGDCTGTSGIFFDQNRRKSQKIMIIHNIDPRNKIIQVRIPSGKVVGLFPITVVLPNILKN